MTFRWVLANGSAKLWTLTPQEEPTRPWDITRESQSSTLHNIHGDYRVNTLWEKRVFTFNWPAACATVDLNIRSMMNVYQRPLFPAKVVWTTDEYGQLDVAPLPGSYSCTDSGYGLFTVSASFAEM